MLKFYNTLAKRVVDFKPLKVGRVLMYSCGPTVYNYPHIGNLRRYVTDDILHRVLVRRGFKVKRIENITDVGHLTQDDLDRGEDKMVVAAKREGKSPLAIADHYTQAFLDDAAALNLLPPDSYTKATDHIVEMQELIKKLLDKKLAYESAGSVYFAVDKFSQYGKLSGNTLTQLKKQVRPELNSEAFEQKISPYDFALWIKAAPGHLLQWDSPWSRGYPGWHIECAAMIIKHLGESIDIHTGGEDNIFPHHEDEIAETEPVTGKPLAKYWLHTRHLFVDGKKMAKREGNFVRLRDVVAQDFNPLALRYLFLGAHFSAHLNFTWEALRAANEGWQRLQEVVAKLRENLQQNPTGRTNSGLVTKLEEITLRYDAALDDNLGTPQALAVLSDLIALANSELDKKSPTADLQALLEKFLEFDQILGLMPQKPDDFLPENELAQLAELLRERAKARASQDFIRSDELRGELAVLGFDIQDTDQGVRWIKKATGQRGLFKK